MLGPQRRALLRAGDADAPMETTAEDAAASDEPEMEGAVADGDETTDEGATRGLRSTKGLGTTRAVAAAGPEAERESSSRQPQRGPKRWVVIPNTHRDTWNMVVMFDTHRDTWRRVVVFDTQR